jgi:DegV family protein with EDD domain
LAVKVITDSTCDMPTELTQELGIRVVPVYVRFGDKVYRDGVDIQSDELYEMLTTSPHHPATSQPTPEDFTSVYKDYCESVDGIISIHISSKVSGTYNSAMIAKKTMESRCPIEVIDSKFNSAGMAIIVMAAARMAQAGMDMETIVEETRRAIGQVHMFGVFETMKYLARSGRISKAIVAAANILNVLPLLTFHEGEIVRAGLVRSFSKGLDKIYQFAESKPNISELIIVHSAILEKAEAFRKRLGWLFPEEYIRIMKLGAGLGVHGGPGVLLIGLRQEE